MGLKKTEVLIIGAGTGGLSVASRLAKSKVFKEIAVVDPASRHFYQPLWTLVGAGAVSKESTERSQADLIPKGVDWIRESINAFQPEQNQVTTTEGNTISYDYLVVAPGMEIFWDRIKGLSNALGHDGVCSNYSFDSVDTTWKFIREFRGGKAIFTFPNTPVKCGGAPQKIMYLAEDYFRKHGVRKQCEVKFISAGASIFAVKKYAEALNKVIAKREIQTLFKHNLIEVKPETKTEIGRAHV